ncbi:MAG: hypothetical protein K2X47_07345 [Bdellovibrionales bacterium]|nr:hypothetical protein [Bdellovibrionales bacterium]
MMTKFIPMPFSVWSSAFLVLGTLVLTEPTVAANSLWTDVEEGTPYDTLVQKFSRNETRLIQPSGDWLDRARIHLGVGVVNSVYSVAHISGGRVQVSGSGFLASLGMDLFSPRWIAEGSIVSYGSQNSDRAEVTLREFDLRLIYRTLPTGLFGVKLFGGLAARNLRINHYGVARDAIRDYTTPSSILGVGSDINIAEAIQLALEISTRNSMIDESPDQSTLDLTVRLNTQF